MLINLKVGQQLWDLRYGRVTVTHLNRDYPIEVVTEKGLTLCYDAYGHACISHKYPLLISLNEEFRIPQTNVSIRQSEVLDTKNSCSKK